MNWHILKHAFEMLPKFYQYVKLVFCGGKTVGTKNILCTKGCLEWASLQPPQQSEVSHQHLHPDPPL